jgi:hypothetical protein
MGAVNEQMKLNKNRELVKTVANPCIGIAGSKLLPGLATLNVES